MKWAVVGPRGMLAHGASCPTPSSAASRSATGRACRGRRAPSASTSPAKRPACASKASSPAGACRWSGSPPRRRPVASSTATSSPASSARTAGPRSWPRACAPSSRTSEPQPVVVVNAGTAVTIDTLDARGRLPRRHDPAEHAPDDAGAGRQHRGAQGRARPRSPTIPTNTADAIYTGALYAVCGAIELARGRLPRTAQPTSASSRAVRRPISRRISPSPVELVDNLVLEGVLALANELGGPR